MQLMIDGRTAETENGESLLSIVKRIGLDTDSLKTRPLAAMIGTDVFPLLYSPTQKNGEVEGDESMRRAARRANGVIRLLRFQDNAGYMVYERSALFIFILAVRRCFPSAKVKFDFSLGQGIFCEVNREESPELTGKDIQTIKDAFQKIVEEDRPLVKKHLDVLDAVDVFTADGQQDKVRLLEWRPFSFFNVYELDGYKDYFYGEMVPSTGYVKLFDIVKMKKGVILLKPDKENPDKVADAENKEKLYKRFRISDDWNSLMECSVVADLNDKIRSGEIRELVRVNEALHEREFAAIASKIVNRNAKVVMIAGPSSSGKTTSANRLCVQLRVLGKKPILMSLDDYYLDRDKIEKEPDGSIDLEHIRTIDTELFGENLRDLLNNKCVQIPSFDFLKQKRFYDENKKLRIDDNAVLVIEGIHALNPVLLPDEIDRKDIFKLSLTALTTLNLDDHNRIPTTQIRLLRRIVRDYNTRGASIERTLSMWDSVRRGEERWIFPFQEEADEIFDSALVYEPAVLKKYIYPILINVRPDNPYYYEVHTLMKFLNYFLVANVEDEIPPTSVIREFIGGNTFYE